MYIKQIVCWLWIGFMHANIYAQFDQCKKLTIPDLAIDTNSFKSLSGKELMDIQDDGKMIIKMSYLTRKDHEYDVLLRLHKDGSVDTSFRFKLPESDHQSYFITCIAVQPDQKILVGGFTKTQNGFEKNGDPYYMNFPRLLRLHPDGAIDSLFKRDITGAGTIHCIYILPNQNILIGGKNCLTMKDSAGNKISDLMNYNFKDWLFAKDIIMDFQQNTLLVRGAFKSSKNKVMNMIFVNNDGIVDSTRSIAFSAPTDMEIYQFAIQHSGKLLVTGHDQENKGLYRMGTDGKLDATFRLPGDITYITGAEPDFIYSRIMVDENDRIYMCYYQDKKGYFFGRFLPDGKLDKKFKPYALKVKIPDMAEDIIYLKIARESVIIRKYDMNGKDRILQPSPEYLLIPVKY
jgi:hypothetical protein